MANDFPKGPVDGQVHWHTPTQIFTWSTQVGAWLPPSLSRTPGMDPGCKTTWLIGDTQVSNSGGWTALLNTGEIGAPGQRWKLSAMVEGFTTVANWFYTRIHDGVNTLVASECVVAGNQWDKPCPLEIIYNMTKATTFYLEAGGSAGSTNYALAWCRWGFGSTFPAQASNRLTSLSAERMV